MVYHLSFQIKENKTDTNYFEKIESNIDAIEKQDYRKNISLFATLWLDSSETSECPPPEPLSSSPARPAPCPWVSGHGVGT